MTARILTLLVLTFCLSVIVYAQSASVIVNEAQLRGTPSENGSMVQTLPRETPVTIIVQRGTWFLVQAPHYTGWMQGNTIQLDKISVSTPEYERPAAAESPFMIPGIVFVKSSDPAPKSPETTVTKSAVFAEPVVKVATGRCKDGSETFSETKQGACSDHGGIADWFAETKNKAEAAVTPPSSGTVHVNGYYRKDGTYVRSYTRRKGKN